MVGVTEKLADFAVTTNRSRIPGQAIDIAKKAVLDAVGVMIAGSNEPVVSILAEQADHTGAAAEAAVVCQNFQTSADLAAWVNGAACHALDYDDTFADSVGYNMHPTVSILPAVLALGEKSRASGMDVITAYIIGIEVESKLGLAIGRYASELCWHPTPILGVIGAAAASSKILHLNTRQARMAFGIASSFAGGITRNFGTMTKPLHAGNAARGGVVAALLAGSGFTADPSVMEGKSGFCDIFSGGKAGEIMGAGPDPEDDWDIVSQGISFKPYPCCRGTHPSIDAVLKLRKKYCINAENVDSIICKTRPEVPQMLRHHRPKTGLEAKFSLEYCTAVALLKGKVLLEDFSNERVKAADAQELLRKVNYLHPQEWERESSLSHEVVIKLKDGSEYSCKVTSPKGEPGNPVSSQELMDKFTDCAHIHFHQTEIEQIAEMVSNLESLEKISWLMQILNYKTRANRQGGADKKNYSE